MNIREAILKARKTGDAICRPFGETGAMLVAKPQDNTHLQAGIFRKGMEIEFHKNWMIQISDLTADDWELFTQ